MENRVRTLALDENDLPIVPGAHHVTRQDPVQPKLFVAYAPFVNHKPAWHAYLYEQDPGIYLVFADAATMAMVDPLSEGVEFDKYTGKWTTYCMDGHEPDFSPGAEPGATQTVADRVVTLAANPPADVSDQKPYTVDPAKELVATKIWRSVWTSCGDARAEDLRPNKKVAKTLE